MAGTEQNEIAQMRKITDKLYIDLMSDLGHGAKSTVFVGKFEDRFVAIKRIKCKDDRDAQKTVSEFEKSREKMIMNMVEGDRHPNIIGYYGSEFDKMYMYIALELCNGNLSHYVNREDLQTHYPPSKVNVDIASGIAFLHAKNIAHRDIKPENIYYVLKDDKICRIVIGDFGTSKTTTNDLYSITAEGVGTLGYISFEVMKEIDRFEETNPKKRMSLKSDIFALGCVFHYTITKGAHPFGRLNKQQNIIGEKPPNTESLEPWQDPLKRLLIKMLSHDPAERPTAEEVRRHPALWSASKIMKFFEKASDALEASDDRIRIQFENPDVIWRGNWTINLPVSLQTYLENYKRGGRYIYMEKSKSVYGFLRTIRNINHHFNSLPIEVQTDLGSTLEEHVKMWMSMCPLILMHLYNTNFAVKLPGVEYGKIDEHTASVSISRPDPDDRQGAEVIRQGQTNSEDQSVGSYATPYYDRKDIVSSISSKSNSQERIGVNVINTDSVNEYVNRLSIDPGLACRTSVLPEIVTQSIKYFKSDIASWSMNARDEIEMAKQLGLAGVEGKQIVLCLDISESMAKGNAWSQVKQFTSDVLTSFEALSHLLGGEQLECIAISTFGHETKVLQKSTRNASELRAAFDRIKLGGPTPMHGGILLASAAAGAIGVHRGKPTIVIVSDFIPTETLCFAGPDQPNQNLVAETQYDMSEFLTRFKEVSNIILVPVGDFDRNLVDKMKSWTEGEILSHMDGRKLFNDSLQKESNVTSKDVYKEIEDSNLPTIGSRVRRGQDWIWENQDSGGNGTIIGHDEDNCVWVEWDNNGTKCRYRYGTYGNYDLSIIDQGRAIHGLDSLDVGCFVSHHAHGPRKGVIIKKEHNGKFLVKWENGESAEYSFGQDGVFELWPWEPPSSPSMTAGMDEQLVGGSTSVITPKKGKQKNLNPTKKT